jgi:phage anti-repressor protein
MINLNENNKILGDDLHSILESKLKDYSIWVKRKIQDADLISGKDFSTILSESSGGRPKTNYYFTIDAAKEICLLEKNKKGKELRRWLIGLSNQHESGLAFTAPQIEALIDLSKAMTLVSIQKEVEKKHFNIYNDKFTWYQHRAELLGYETKDVIKAMQNVNKKHTSTRASLMILDSNELIRIGVIDFMFAMGKSIEYSTNAGNLCKSIASKMKLGNIIWDDTAENPLKLNQSEISDRKLQFNQAKSIL